MQPETVNCSSWADFRQRVVSQLFQNEPFVRGRFLFRGQRDAGVAAQSSYDRWFEGTQFPESKRVQVADRLLDRFQQEIEGIQPAGAGAMERGEVLALAQHYGLPTRLLDWTESPYIAAFFAFSEGLQTSSGKGKLAVYALDSRSYVWQSRGVSLIRVPPKQNVRLRNQDGRFTLLESPCNSLEEHLALLSEDGPWPLYQFVLPVQEARHALSDLDLMGITAARLYPDLQGCALNAKLSVLLDGRAESFLARA